MHPIRATVTQVFFHPAFIRLRQIQFLFALIVFCYMALKPLDGPPGNIPPAMLHFVGNTLLIASAWAALHPLLQLKTIFVLTVFISGLAELCQSLTGTRVTDLFDFLANAAGLLFGLLLCFLAEKYIAPPKT